MLQDKLYIIIVIKSCLVKGVVNMANMWMVRAGENAFLIDDFKELSIVPIGWEIGDLSGKTPDEIKQLVAKKYPEASKTGLGLNSGQIIRFACD